MKNYHLKSEVNLCILHREDGQRNWKTDSYYSMKVLALNMQHGAKAFYKVNDTVGEVEKLLLGLEAKFAVFC